MKIYIINEMGRASVYGIGSYVNETARTIRKLGYDVGIIKMHYGQTVNKELQKDGIEVISIPAPRTIIRYSRYYRNVTLILRAMIPEENEQYVFQLNFLGESIMIDLLRMYFPGCIITYTIHFFGWGLSLSGNGKSLKQIIEGKKDQYWDKEFREGVLDNLRLEQKMLNKTDYVICLSKYAKRSLEEFYLIETSKIRVIYNGLSDEKHFLSELDKADLKKKYHLHRKEKIIIFAGRVEEGKGVPQMIKAYCRLKEEYPLCHLIVAGDGSLQARMDEAGEWIREITFTGRLSKERLYELYSIADIGILPSFSEQCSYVAIEMMMHGLPIIGTNSTGLDEMIIEEETGLKLSVIDDEYHVDLDIDLLKDTILLLLQNDQLRKTMGQKGRERYENFYSSESMGERLRTLYQEIIELAKNE